MKNLVDLIKALSAVNGISFQMLPKQMKDLAKFTSGEMNEGCLIIKGEGFRKRGETIYEHKLSLDTISKEIGDHGFPILITEISLVDSGDEGCDSNLPHFYMITYEDGFSLPTTSPDYPEIRPFFKGKFGYLIESVCENSKMFVGLMVDIDKLRSKYNIQITEL